MKKLLLLPSLFVFALAVTAIPAQAQVRIGTVDMNKIFQSYYKTKEAENRINEARAASKKELDERIEAYKKSVESINKLNEEIQKPELSKDAKEEKSKVREERVQEHQRLEREIAEFRQTREKQLQDQAVRMRNGIVEEITKLVQDKVKVENYDLVLDRSGLNLNGVPVLLYAKESMDFSDDIIVQLNKNKPKDSGAGADKPAPGKK